MADDVELRNFMNSIPNPDAVNPDEDDELGEGAECEALGIYENVADVADEFSEEAVNAAIADGPTLNAPDLEGASIDPTAWRDVGSLAGYFSAGIRAYGRPIFMNFPCFREHSDTLRRIGRDGLAEVRVMAVGWGSSEVAMREVIEWIDRHGAVIGSDTMDFEGPLKNYHPRVTFAISDDNSFLLVQETRETGAPKDANYVYAWPGGRRIYQDDVPAAKALASLCDNVHNPVLERLPAEALAAAEELEADFEEDLEEEEVHEETLVAPAPPVAVSAPAPAGGVEKSGLAKMRDAGLTMEPSDTGPVLVGESSDGKKFTVSGVDGKSLVLASSYNVTFYVDDVPQEVLEDVDVNDVLGVINGSPAAKPA